MADSKRSTSSQESKTFNKMLEFYNVSHTTNRSNLYQAKGRNSQLRVSHHTKFLIAAIINHYIKNTSRGPDASSNLNLKKCKNYSNLKSSNGCHLESLMVISKNSISWPSPMTRSSY